MPIDFAPKCSATAGSCGLLSLARAEARKQQCKHSFWHEWNSCPSRFVQATFPKSLSARGRQLHKVPGKRTQGLTLMQPCSINDLTSPRNEFSLRYCYGFFFTACLPDFLYENSSSQKAISAIAEHLQNLTSMHNEVAAGTFVTPAISSALVCAYFGKGFAKL